MYKYRIFSLISKNLKDLKIEEEMLEKRSRNGRRFGRGEKREGRKQVDMIKAHVYIYGNITIKLITLHN
jgi:hypothetical protein